MGKQLASKYNVKYIETSPGEFAVAQHRSLSMGEAPLSLEFISDVWRT